jgi:hypothetical protein
MNEDEQELFDERAAIMQYDGGLTKKRAEQLALVWIYDFLRKRNNGN